MGSFRQPDQRRNRDRASRLVALAVVFVAAVPLLVGTGGFQTRSFAQDAEVNADLDAKLDEVGSIVMRDATLVDWLFAIQQEWNINIVAGDELQKHVVNGSFKDTRLRDILDQILYVHGYGYQPVGKGLMILKQEDIGTIQPQFRTEVISLEYLTAAEAEPSVRLLLSPNGTVQPIPSSESIVVIDLPERIQRVREHLSILESNAKASKEREDAARKAERAARQVDPVAPGSGGGQPEIEQFKPEVEIFALQFLDVENIVETIQSVLTTGTVSAIAEENRLVLFAPREEIDAAAQLLQRLDVPRRQVRITALLYDVNVEVSERLGINWSHAAKARIDAAGDPQSLFELNSTNFSTASPAGAAGDAAAAATAATTGALMTLSHLSRHFDVSSIIQALDTTEGARLLARPNIVAYDRNEATFQSVSEIPVQQLTETSQGGSIGTTQFREAGITLNVTPRIMDDGTLLLEVNPEFSVLAGFQSGQPIIDRRQARTMVHMLNGQTTVIGGLLRRNELENQQGVPGLKDWKHFGALFRYHDSTVDESELIVFIKAEIIEPGYVGKPREEVAREVLNDLLDRIPYSTHMPIICHCRDPYCPYHNPRPWGADLYTEADCTSYLYGKFDQGPYGYGNPVQGYPTDVQDFQPLNAPTVDGPVGGYSPEIRQPSGPALVPAPAPAPTGNDPTDTTYPTDTAPSPPVMNRVPNVPNGESSVTVETAARAPKVHYDPPSTDERVHQVPPPVIIEEARRVRRFNGVQTAMRRLPEIDERPTRASASISSEYSEKPLRIPAVDTGTIIR